MQLAKFLATAIQKLRGADIGNPELDARLLVGHVLMLDCAQMLSQSQRELTPDEIGAMKNLLARRMAGEPVARIVALREFWGLAFGLNEATLDPRQDSETLIEAVLLHIKNNPSPAKTKGLLCKPKFSLPLPQGERKNISGNMQILDLGTGTGCLLLALLHELPKATGIGIDINPRAIEQAKENAAVLGLGERSNFRVGNWLEGLEETFDIIVSNPPYIPAKEIPTLMREVRDYDPLQALDGGEDGLDPYRLLIPQLVDFLNPQGLVAFEVGYEQAQQVADLLRNAGFTNISTFKDLNSIERCITADRPA
jgi:release factor glutamine methyltransferase